jgi:hypothetical protein
VSRLFPEEVGIFVGPSKVLLVKTRGMKAKCVAEQAVTVGAGHPGDWAPALAALDAELEQGSWGKARARIVVSDHWVRYEVLPWSVELSKETERLAHARFLLSATYGDMVEQWAVTLSEAAPGAARLVSAIPESLLAELKATVSAHGLKLLSLQPQLVVAYNLWRHRLPRAAAWFATIDESSLVAMHLSEGRCDRVRAVRISDNWGLELKRIQTMGRLAQSRPAEGPVFVDAPLAVRMMAGPQRAEVEWLESEPKPSGTLARLAALRETHA